MRLTRDVNGIYNILHVVSADLDSAEFASKHLREVNVLFVIVEVDSDGPAERGDGRQWRGVDVRVEGQGYDLTLRRHDQEIRRSCRTTS